MERVFDYEVLSLQDIENNSHLIFICDGDYKSVVIEREEE